MIPKAPQPLAGNGRVACMRDDLAGLYVAQPPGSAQPMEYRQGVILAFDQTTLTNTVSVGGSTVQDLPILGVAEAASLTVGSVVGIMVVGSTWAIIGRWVMPGTPEAIDAITQVSKRVASASMDDSWALISSTWTDLGDGPGPTVPIHIGASGRAIVMVTAQYLISPDPTPRRGCYCSYAVSGATTRAPAALPVAQFSGTVTGLIDVDTNGFNLVARFTAVDLAEGLTPGINIFTMKYQTEPSYQGFFSDRNITVFGL